MNQQPYNGWMLSGFVCCYVAFWSFIIAAANLPADPTSNIIGSIGEGLLWGMLLTILIVDFKGYVSLKGLINWRNLTGAKKAGLFCVLTFLFPVTLAFYLIRALVTSTTYRQQARLGNVSLSPTGRKPIIAIVCGTLAAVLVFSFYATVVHSNQRTTTAQTDTTPTLLMPTSTTTLLPTATPELTATSTQRHPTYTPTPTATSTPKPVATAKSTPTPCPGVNCNPWGYNFTAGNLIYNPPSNFCSYFNCITSFWEPDDPGDGYVVQCADETYSQSGGERGACSSHGGVGRPLYSH